MMSVCPLPGANENQLALWRGTTVGIVFQFFQLLPTLTALENVMLPMELRGLYRGERRQRALAALAEVGLAERVDQLPSELAGGEQQRVAIARALANEPPILLADEPTGNLDTATGLQIVELLANLSARGKTVVLVTHDATLTARAARCIHMRDGKVIVADGSASQSAE
jgi:putative ABC transport system ATP-binding protein